VTPEQRRQAIDFGKTMGTGMVISTGLSTPSSRAHSINIYYETPVAPSPFFFWRNKNRTSQSWDSKTIVSTSWTKKATPSTNWEERIPPPDSSTQVI